MTTEAVIDLGLLGERFLRDPYPFYATLRERGPVHRVRTAEGNEAWLVVGYDETRAVLADPRLSKVFPSREPGDPPLELSPAPHMLLFDPPDHTRLRRLVVREFTPRRVAAMAPRVQEITDTLLDAMLAAPDRRADLVDSLAFPLPITVICELLGVPFLDRETFRDWTARLFSVRPIEEKRATRDAMTAYIDTLLAAKRARPGDDLMSALLHTADEDGDRLSAAELVGMAWLLLVAGHETTVNLVSNGVLALLRHPEQADALRADPSLVEGAVEEMLRYDAPVPVATMRFATVPFELAGTRVETGDAVLATIADADRDPARYPEGDRFDVRRETGGHLAFGHGIHYCLGAPLARLEARAAVRTLLARAPGLTLDGEPGGWRTGTLFHGPSTLPVRW
ncbi:cytochrome P450 family protein [Streptomyces avicenniae]|uniref:cytochrome P450 family protein n=1 Tax=Streptomyces avicenniae TaxID=500153 RepID=UPI00069AA483|nr:cytochrome P450 [Streptomyces avicenniae]